MQTSVPPPTPRDASCADASSITTPVTVAVPVHASVRAPLFPPQDADPETRRRWLATSPWPEVAFASAGAV